MQLLCESSTEDGETKGLSLIDGNIKRFNIPEEDQRRMKVPNVGFNTVEQIKENRIMNGMNHQIDYYFTHSYRLGAKETKFVVGKTNHIDEFASVIEKDNIIGTQFHPEKSQSNGIIQIIF